MARELPLNKTPLRLPAVLFALSDPTRLRIVRTLDARGETMCGAVGLSLAKSSCSRHFKVLREAGVIGGRRVGTAYLNSLCRAELDARFPGLLDAVLRGMGAGKAISGSVRRTAAGPGRIARASGPTVC